MISVESWNVNQTPQAFRDLNSDSPTVNSSWIPEHLYCFPWSLPYTCSVMGLFKDFKVVYMQIWSLPFFGPTFWEYPTSISSYPDCPNLILRLAFCLTFYSPSTTHKGEPAQGQSCVSVDFRQCSSVFLRTKSRLVSAPFLYSLLSYKYYLWEDHSNISFSVTASI